MRCAGIVTYNPDLERLRANLNNTASQVDAVFVFDNGSENVADIRSLADSEYTTLRVEADPNNRGIAFALNRLLDAAKEHGFKHMLLLDQDSVPTEGMCDELERHLTGSVALVCPFILDRNRMTEEEWQAQKMPPLERLTHAAKHGAITSGSLVDVAAALEVGGFDDNLFIDYVDFDFNERLILNGYEIVKDNTVYLLHEKGKSERTWLRCLATRRRVCNGSRCISSDIRQCVATTSHATALCIGRNTIGTPVARGLRKFRCSWRCHCCSRTIALQNCAPIRGAFTMA